MATGFERLNVLIVDDNRHMRLILKNVLNAFGIRAVTEASDGADAFKELRTMPIDIVITDWVMAPLDGIEFVKLVRTAKDSPNPFVPIIMLTGHTEMHRIVEARDSGINEFLAKPISAKALYQRLVSIVNKPRPYIRAGRYFGPDRRRRDMDYTGTERRQDRIDKANEGAGLSQAEVEALLNG